MPINPAPVRYLDLIPKTVSDFCEARVPVVSYHANAVGTTGSILTEMGSPRDFLSLSPDQAKRVLANLVRHADWDARGESRPFVRDDLLRTVTGRADLIPVIQGSAFRELGGLGHWFAKEVIHDEGGGNSNSLWIADHIHAPEVGPLELSLRMPDAGQRAIRCAVDERACHGVLSVNEGDLSLAFYVTPEEVAQAGLAFYSGIQGLADYIGLTSRQFSVNKKPIAKWMQRGLEKLAGELFQTSSGIEFTPVSWSRESDALSVQERDGVIVSGSVFAQPAGNDPSHLGQVVLRMSLVKSWANEVSDDESGNRRVEVLRGKPMPRLFVEILCPLLLSGKNRLSVGDNLKDWIGKVWSGEFSA